MPVRFKIGDKSNIECINEGLIGLHIGAHIEIWCPSMMAYKSKEKTKIPSFSNLYMKIEILDITPGDRTESEKESYKEDEEQSVEIANDEEETVVDLTDEKPKAEE